MKKVNLKEARGITLVALVITVIILLILAGVTLNLVVGENGLIAKSKRATEEYKQKAEQEGVQLGDFEQGINEYNENKDVMKILVNSGDDGKVGLPIQNYGKYNFEIDWGDGKKEVIKKEVSKIENNKRLASKDKIILVGLISPTSVAQHEYADNNKEYEVQIKGIFNSMYSYSEGATPEKIVKIIQWGEVGIKLIGLYECINLKEIAQPTQNSFKDLEYISFYGCSSLQSIPERLFANCPNVTNFDSAFEGCSNLQSIPERLFANCPNVRSFDWTFAYCSSLTGKAIELWKEGREGINENIGGNSCYYGCTGLEDYEQIPEYWKEEPAPPQ